MQFGWTPPLNFFPYSKEETRQVQAVGPSWVRHEFFLFGCQTISPGVYSWSTYDALVRSLPGTNFFFIAWNHWDHPPATDAERAQFADWLVQSARHFRTTFPDRKFIFDLWNEPNTTAWKRDDIKDYSGYIALALTTGKAMKAAGLDSMFTGPSASGVSSEEIPFLTVCCRAGLLNYWSGLTVHPYRVTDPESAATQFRQIRTLIRKFGPAGKTIPIIAGEWGYSALPNRSGSELQQAQYDVRMQMSNLAEGVPLTILYEWHHVAHTPPPPNAASLPPDPEYYYEIVNKDRSARLAELAMQAFTRCLSGYRFNKRLAVGSVSDYVLLFDRSSGDEAIVAWTTSANDHVVTIPVSTGPFKEISMAGVTLPDGAADRAGLTVSLTGSPVYLFPRRPNELLELAAAWQRAPLDTITGLNAPNVGLSFTNPLDRKIKVENASQVQTLSAHAETLLSFGIDPRREAIPGPQIITMRFPGEGAVSQFVNAFDPDMPLEASILPPATGRLFVRLDNPSGEPLSVVAQAQVDVNGKRVSIDAPLKLSKGQVSAIVDFQTPKSLDSSNANGVRVSFALKNSSAKALLRTSSTLVPVQLPLSESFPAEVEGSKVTGTSVLLSTSAAASSDPYSIGNALKIDYHIEPQQPGKPDSWSLVSVHYGAGNGVSLNGKPTALGLWVYGDHSNEDISLRIVDSTGQSFAPTGVPVDWSGWRYVTIPINHDQFGFWWARHFGGANDSIIHYPVSWQILAQVENPTDKSVTGSIKIARPTVIY